MHTFEIAQNNGFPAKMQGYLAPDDGNAHNLEVEAGNFIGLPERNVIALFIAEHIGQVSQYFIESMAAQPDIVSLSGIITFGRRGPNPRLFQTKSHFEIVAGELQIPLLCLNIPDQYPTYRLDDSEQGFMNQWVRKNPLKELYRRHVLVDVRGTSAIIEAA